MISKLVQTLELNDVPYLPSEILIEHKKNNLKLEHYSYRGFDGFKDILHVTFYSHKGLTKGWNEYFFGCIDFSAEKPDLIFAIHYTNRGIQPTHQDPHSSLRKSSQGFTLLFNKYLGKMNLHISQPLRDFFHDSSTLLLGNFLQWFSFDYERIYSIVDNQIIGTPKGSNLSFIAKIESFSTAYYFLKSNGFIKDLIDEEGKLIHSTSRSYFGGLIKSGYEVESLNIGVAYAYYQGDNPRDGHASFKIDFSDLRNIRECYKKSYRIDSDNNNDLPF